MIVRADFKKISNTSGSRFNWSLMCFVRFYFFLRGSRFRSNSPDPECRFQICWRRCTFQRLYRRQFCQTRFAVSKMYRILPTSTICFISFRIWALLSNESINPPSKSIPGRFPLIWLPMSLQGICAALITCLEPCSAVSTTQWSPCPAGAISA